MYTPIYTHIYIYYQWIYLKRKHAFSSSSLILSVVRFHCFYLRLCAIGGASYIARKPCSTRSCIEFEHAQIYRLTIIAKHYNGALIHCYIICYCNSYLTLYVCMCLYCIYIHHMRHYTLCIRLVYSLWICDIAIALCIYVLSIYIDFNSSPMGIKQCSMLNVLWWTHTHTNCFTLQHIKSLLYIYRDIE